MKIIFLTLVDIRDVEAHGIYTDLMRKFRDEGHDVVIVSPRERRTGEAMRLFDDHGVRILAVKTLNIQKTNIVEKGIGTLLLERQFCKAIQKHLGQEQFDLILYSTPPITFSGVIKWLKKHSPKAVSYLMLKDIFPQNAVDMGMFSEKSLFYKYFRNQEVELYKLSDYIGCMSPANVQFLLRHNPYIDPATVGLAPNSIDLPEADEVRSERWHQQADAVSSGSDTSESSPAPSASASEPNSQFSILNSQLRQKYALPLGKPIFVYGGNLGRPQGIGFMLECMERVKDRGDCHFLIVGSGTEYPKIQEWMEREKPSNITLFARLPKDDYERLVAACDAGLIFLDHRFTIPNFPSRLLSYLACSLPVVVASDPNCDMGPIAEEAGFGRFCESNDSAAFARIIDDLTSHPEKMKEMGRKGLAFLKANYLTENTYSQICEQIKLTIDN